MRYSYPMGFGQSEVDSLEKRIREGGASEVREWILTLDPDEVPRARLPIVVQFSWRSGCAAWGLKALRPAVRVRNDANDGERLEYAACLLRGGLIDEGLDLLATLPAKQFPRALLYRAFAWMSRWDYERALPYLRAYLKTVKPRSYHDFMARVNVAACLNFLRDDVKSEHLLSGLLHDTHLKGYRLLLGNALHLAAAHDVERGRNERALLLLSQAGECLGSADPLHEMLVLKWEAVIRFRESHGDEGSREALLRVKHKATDLCHWETLRDCDRFIALQGEDTRLARHLVFGTPFEAFRKRFLREWPGELDVGEQYELKLGKSSRAKLDWLTEGGPLKVGQLQHRTLVELTKDFYRPAFPAELFARLFPDEHYHPESSAHRVHEAIRRLRDAFEENRVPLDVEFAGGFYRLISRSGITLRLPRPDESALRQAPTVIRLRRRFGSDAFGLAAAIKELELPRRSVQRLLKELVGEAGLKVEGRGKSTRYRVTTETTNEPRRDVKVA